MTGGLQARPLLAVERYIVIFGFSVCRPLKNLRLCDEQVRAYAEKVLKRRPRLRFCRQCFPRPTSMLRFFVDRRIVYRKPKVVRY